MILETSLAAIAKVKSKKVQKEMRDLLDESNGLRTYSYQRWDALLAKIKGRWLDFKMDETPAWSAILEFHKTTG